VWGFVNGYLIEYIIGNTYVTVTRGHKDEFGRFIGEEMVFRSESAQECVQYAETH
jgi:hypothetical protein